MKRIVITGGTGLIGSDLMSLLEGKYYLTILTRHPKRWPKRNLVEYIYWDGKSEITSILNYTEGIINLIGENIGKKRWNKKQKQTIINSRRNAAIAIKNSIEKCHNKPKVWIQASATGFYGQHDNIVLDEQSPKGENSFLADVCEEWEKPIQELNSPETRKVIIRTGVVLAKKSDLWKQLTMSFRFGVAAIPGSGKQYLPWIHLRDETRAIAFLLENESHSGIFNLVAPGSSTMKDITDRINDKKKAVFKMHIPAWFLSIIFGKEKTREIILTNQRVIPKHLLDEGFTFEYPNIADAIKELIKP